MLNIDEGLGIGDEVANLLLVRWLDVRLGRKLYRRRRGHERGRCRPGMNLSTARGGRGLWSHWRSFLDCRRRRYTGLGDGRIYALAGGSKESIETREDKLEAVALLCVMGELDDGVQGSSDESPVAVVEIEWATPGRPQITRRVCGLEAEKFLTSSEI